MPYTLAWTSLAGVTGTIEWLGLLFKLLLTDCWALGNLLVLIMVLMYTTAVDSVRRRYFNVFYFTHHLFVLFFILLLLHGPNFWMWFIIPGTLYLVERIMREYRGKQTTEVAMV
jgi:hypothetical protein